MTSPGYFLTHLWLIPLFPLVSAAVMYFFGRHLSKEAVNLFCVGSVFLSFLHALGAVLKLFTLPATQRTCQQILFEWVTPGSMPTSTGLVNFVADWGYLLDPLSSVMVIVVTLVGFLIHVYSIGYTANEDGYYRFFGYLSLFMFSMLTLVLANNLLLLFAGWEGVGLCSYLLIGFYFLKKSAADAGKKAFLVNRIGDAGFLLGLLLVAATFGTVRFTSQDLGDPAAFSGIAQLLSSMVAQHVLSYGSPVFTAMALLLFVGAAGISAQIPLHVWLPDAMEGPTPVSALIHAATMVTAGVYMVVRMSAIYQLAPVATDIVAFIGAATAIFAATLAVVQTDIKKVLAYSTIGQIGYMFLALGVGAFAAGIFHLMTHAFFQALLFLGAGSIIHSLSGEQDIRKMGGLRYTIPATSVPFIIATMAIAGVPGLSGFFSKNEILGHAFYRHQMLDRYLALWAVGIGTAGLTAFYMFRLLFEAFYGMSRLPVEMEGHIHESPKTMTVPLMILAFFSIVSGWLALPILWGEESPFERFLEPSLRGVETNTGAIALSLVSIIYGAVVCLMQKDVKRLLAYSSVSSLGFCALGIFALTPQGLTGSVLQQINHGISTGALFLIVGVLYERRHTSLISEFGGLATPMPNFAAIYLIVSLSSLGMPLLNGFISEFTILQGVFVVNKTWAAWASLGIVLGAAYLLLLYQRIIFGPITHEANKPLPDLNLREYAVLVPLVVLAFWIGIYPKPFFAYIEKPVQRIVQQVNPAFYHQAGSPSSISITSLAKGGK